MDTKFKNPPVYGVLNMFKSARLKLTFFYLFIIVVFNLSVTLGLKAVATKEYVHSNRMQLSRVQDMTDRFFGTMPPRAKDRPDMLFRDTQDDAAASARQHLTQGLLLINLGALVVGGFLSYWFAGRTLRPIEKSSRSAKAFHIRRQPRVTHAAYKYAPGERSIFCAQITLPKARRVNK